MLFKDWVLCEEGPLLNWSLPYLQSLREWLPYGKCSVKINEWLGNQRVLPWGIPSGWDHRMMFGLRMVAGSGGRWHVYGRVGGASSEDPDNESSSFLPSVSLVHRRTVSPGLRGSEEKVPSRGFLCYSGTSVEQEAHTTKPRSPQAGWQSCGSAGWHLKNWNECIGRKKYDLQTIMIKVRTVKPKRQRGS